MSLENLLKLNKLARGVIRNVYKDEPGEKITEAVMFPVAEAILDSLVREHLPPHFAGTAEKELIFIIGIDGKSLHAARAILREDEEPEGMVTTPKGGLMQEFRPFERLDEQFVNAVVYSTFYYLFNKPLHEMAPSGICSNRENSQFTVTLTLTATELTGALEKFISKNQISISKTSDRELKVRMISGIENTNAYVKSMNDKLNEVSAIINDFRREVVTIVDGIARTANKLLDLVTPLAVKTKGKKDKAK